MPEANRISNNIPTGEISVPVLRRAAMDFLARREHSSFELLQKLTQKFPDADHDMLIGVLTQLREDKLQSDERFVEAFVRYRKSRGFGYHHIRSDLLDRRVNEELLSQYLFEDDEAWLEIATNLVCKRMLPGDRLTFASSEHRRLLRFLENRGLPGSIIRQVIEPLLKAPSLQKQVSC